MAPLYDYECDSCQAHWEELQSIHATPVTLCPTCGAERAVRVMSGGNASGTPGFELKGSGWARDGYTLRCPPSCGR